LNALTHKNAKFEWSDETQSAFEVLKGLMSNSPVMAFPRDNVETRVFTDASHSGLGATLEQMQPDGTLRPVAYASRTLLKHEKNYSATEIEMLGALFAIETFRPYIHGRFFTLVTDHCSLCQMMKAKDPTGKLARWALRLQPYNFEIEYKNGKKHLQVDG